MMALALIQLHPPSNHAPSFSREIWVVYGDSKSCETCYQVQLAALLAPAAATHGIVLVNISRSGGRVYGEPSGMRNAVWADIAHARNLSVTKVLFNLGVNDAGGQTKAQWETACGELMDAFRVAFPTVEFYMMKPWGRAINLVDIHASITTMIASRSWVHEGPDETVFLENGDDGVTYTSDGIHPNAAGKQLTAEQWKTVLGY